MNFWVTDFQEAPIKPSASMWNWMQTKTSLTQKAQNSCKTVHLALIKEGWQKEKTNNAIFIREINMICDGKLAWYAKTQIPKQTYEKRARQFKALQERPIGEILYHDPNIIRKGFTYAYLTPGSDEYQWAIKHYPQSTDLPSYLWGRKSVFLIEGEPLYLLEVFFPGKLFNDFSSEESS